MSLHLKSLFKEGQNYYPYLTKALVLFFTYIIGARIGFSLDPVGGFATLVWPPTGIALAGLVLFGTKLWPAVFAGAFSAAMLQGATAPVGFGIAVGNTLEAFVGAYLLNRYINFRPSLERLVDSLGLIIHGALISTMISALIGPTSLLLGGVISTDNFAEVWITWWLGDVMGDLVIAPLILIWATKPSVSIDYQRLPEFLLATFLLIASVLILFTPIFGLGTISQPFSYLVFPPLMWFALRFSQKETITASFLLLLIAIVSTRQEIGPFVRSNLSESLLRLQSFMAVITATLLVMSSIMAERNQLEERKDEFISLASHELKTPLATVSGLNQLLIMMFKKRKEKTVLSYLKSTKEQTDRLTNLVNNLLDLSKITSGKLDIVKEECSIQKLLKETIESFRISKSSHKIILNGSFKGNIYADKGRIAQVLQNLISNAIKYSPDGKKVVVSIRRSGNEVIVAVKDYGIGIPQEYKDKIFDRFFRVSGEGTHLISGLGLGLYLTAKIVKEHGGNIWLESKVGQGSIFYFSLPFGK